MENKSCVLISLLLCVLYCLWGCASTSDYGVEPEYLYAFKQGKVDIVQAPDGVLEYRCGEATNGMAVYKSYWFPEDARYSKYEEITAWFGQHKELSHIAAMDLIRKAPFDSLGCSAAVLSNVIMTTTMSDIEKSEWKRRDHPRSGGAVWSRYLTLRSVLKIDPARLYETMNSSTRDYIEQLNAYGDFLKRKFQESLTCISTSAYYRDCHKYRYRWIRWVHMTLAGEAVENNPHMDNPEISSAKELPILFFHSAINDLNKNREDVALHKIDVVRMCYPKMTELLLFPAMHFIEKKNDSRAMRQIERALEADPENRAVHAALYDACMLKHNDSAKAWLEMAEKFLALKKPDLAIWALQKAAYRSADSSRIYLLLSKAHKMNNNWVAAEKYEKKHAATAKRQ